jgi:hypothetical protein
MDRLAAAAARLAGWPEGSLVAVYEPAEAAGVARLRDRREAAVAMAPLPFLVAHGERLRLRPRLLVEAAGGTTETWALVARKGRVRTGADLAGFAVQSTAGWAPGFVRGALAPWGALPAGAKVVATRQVLSALRKAAAGEDVALLLDGAQATALPTLPFAAELEVVTRTAPLPGAFVAAVADRLPAARWAALERALAALRSDAEGAAALADLQIAGFRPADDASLAAARRVAEAAR